MSQMNYAFADVLCNYAINFFSTKIIKNLMLINRNFHKKLKKSFYKKKNIYNNIINLEKNKKIIIRYIKKINKIKKKSEVLYKKRISSVNDDKIKKFFSKNKKKIRKYECILKKSISEYCLKKNVYKLN